MFLTFVVALLVGCVVVYAAYKDTKLAVALAAGFAAITLFYVIMNREQPATQQQTVAPSITTPVSEVPASARSAP
ncbi:hypothetical protein ACTWJ8_40380 (plasmid) [Streptomyces sp. SDT5-1]|uniref:hypothetical protein n=1 Tax=Streptomyces sp. SDT5-1 TaxID=3406418 RepID=UPI003FD14C34